MTIQTKTKNNKNGKHSLQEGMQYISEESCVKIDSSLLRFIHCKTLLILLNSSDHFEIISNVRVAEWLSLQKV